MRLPDRVQPRVSLMLLMGCHPRGLLRQSVKDKLRKISRNAENSKRQRWLGYSARSSPTFISMVSKCIELLGVAHSGWHQQLIANSSRSLSIFVGVIGVVPVVAPAGWQAVVLPVIIAPSVVLSVKIAVPIVVAPIGGEVER